MRKSVALAAVLFGLTATAGSITSIDQSSLTVQSGEYFMTINGFGLGSEIVYTRPSTGARYSIEASAEDGRGTEVVAWIPMDIVNKAGSYTVEVLGGTGDTQAVPFTVVKPGISRLSLHLPEILVGLAKSREGAYLEYEVSLSGGEGTTQVDCSPKSGSLFKFGSSQVRCVGSDSSGDRVEGSFDATVWDGESPKITLPKSFEADAEDERGGMVKFEASAVDEIDGELSVKCAPESGSFFVNGRTTVNCEATDLSLNPAYGSFEVFVNPRDPGRLELRTPTEVVAEAGEDGWAVVEFEVTAYGSADPDPVVECSPASGTGFEVGETKVFCTAEDDFGARAEGSFLVIVKKYEGLKLRDVTAEASSPDGAPVPFDTEAEGWSDTLVCSHDSGSLFPFGVTEVSCEDGDRGKGTFNVTVSDTIAPHIADIRAKTRVLDVDEGIDVQVEVDAIDVADAMPRCAISSLADESEGASFDWRITSDLQANVRNASAFRIQVSCVDAAGNRATSSVPVRLVKVGGPRQGVAN